MPNILPCRISHNGPVIASERYWEPSAGAGLFTRIYELFCGD